MKTDYEILGISKAESENATFMSSEFITGFQALQAMHDYASSRSMESQWISVEERLPSEDEIILCLTNSGQSVCEYVNYNDNKSRFYLNDLDYYCELENVTHWMPLPENPPIN